MAWGIKSLWSQILRICPVLHSKAITERLYLEMYRLLVNLAWAGKRGKQLWLSFVFRRAFPYYTGNKVMKIVLRINLYVMSWQLT